MKKVWVKRSAVNIIDSHKEYLDDIPRIASPDYKPTPRDVLLARVRTTNVVMEKYRIQENNFEIYDLGGQRRLRHKKNSVDKCSAIIFVAALSEYDQPLAEDKRANRMEDSLDFFKSICTDSAYAETSILLFLNKMDIFKEKIEYSDIAAQKAFSDYKGRTKSYEDGVAYFQRKFTECLSDAGLSDSFIHITCATDTSNMKFVLNAAATFVKSAVSSDFVNLTSLFAQLIPVFFNWMNVCDLPCFRV